LFLLPLIVVAMAGFRYPDGNETLDIVKEMLLLLLAFSGLAMRVLTVGFAPKGTSGRNTTQIKATALNTTGMYSLLRHPLYLANYVIFLSVLLYINSWWLVLTGTALYWLYYERIMLAEEGFLLSQYGDQYLQWARQTPAVFPRLSQWKPPSLSCSWRNSIRREYSTFFLIVAMFTAVEVGGDYIVLGRFEFEPLWRAIFFSSAAVYLILHMLKKRTRWLRQPGR
jgi:protein-S-isoprenylcysteine O-methyltransferase Ste14